MVKEEEVMHALQAVEDPELDISIVDLGLVYAVRFEDRDEGKHAEIDLTLTSPGCPAAPRAATFEGPDDCLQLIEKLFDVAANVPFVPRHDGGWKTQGGKGYEPQPNWYV